MPFIFVLLILAGCEQTSKQPEVTKNQKLPKLVCVIDTGVYEKHEDLNGKIRKTKSFTRDGLSDGHGHGSKVAGIIAAHSTDQRLLSCKSLDNSGRGYSSRSAKCVDWCVASGAKVINMSFGSLKENSLLRKSIARHIDKGIIFVASAGNRGRKSSKCSYPGLYAGVFNVGALDGKEVAEFSSRGCVVDYYRPGVNIRTTNNRGGYSRVSGTSFAAPQVAAEFAIDADSVLQ